MDFDLLRDPRKLGVHIIYKLIRKTSQDAVEDVIREFNLNPIDATDIRVRLIEKDNLILNVPCEKSEEIEALDWLGSISSKHSRRRRMGSMKSISK